jgi:acyl-CoA thioester hydrolase
MSALSRKPQISRAEYAHFEPLATRWMDNDVYGHVNNVLYYAFFDTAINRYLIAAGGLDIAAGPVIGLAVETHCQFMQPVAFPDTLEIGLRVGKLGSSSVRYELAVFKADQPYAAAVGYFVHVFVDRATQRATPIPAAIRAALERLLRSSESAPDA